MTSDQPVGGRPDRVSTKGDVSRLTLPAEQFAGGAPSFSCQYRQTCPTIDRDRTTIIRTIRSESYSSLGWTPDTALSKRNWALSHIRF
jgi:hypothetical protein